MWIYLKKCDIILIVSLVFQLHVLRHFSTFSKIWFQIDTYTSKYNMKQHTTTTKTTLYQQYKRKWFGDKQIKSMY